MPGPRFLLGVGMPASRCLPGVGIQRGQVYQRSGAGIPEEWGRYTRGVGQVYQRSGVGIPEEWGRYTREVGQVYQRSGAGIPEGSQGWMGMYTHTQHMVPGGIPDGGWGGYVYPPPRHGKWDVNLPGSGHHIQLESKLYTYILLECFLVFGTFW